MENHQVQIHEKILLPKKLMKKLKSKKRLNYFSLLLILMQFTNSFNKFKKILTCLVIVNQQVINFIKNDKFNC